MHFYFFLLVRFEQREVSKSIAVQVTVCEGKLDSGDRLLKLSPFDSSVSAQPDIVRLTTTTLHLKRMNWGPHVH